MYALLAFIPILFCVVMMAVFNWPAKYAMPATWLMVAILGLTFSPVKGPAGNIEFLGHLTLADVEGIQPDTADVVAQAHKTLN